MFIDLLMGNRIAQACRDSWNQDGALGRINAFVAVSAVAISIASGLAKLIQTAI
jgi:hypothetical protein